MHGLIESMEQMLDHLQADGGILFSWSARHGEGRVKPASQPLNMHGLQASSAITHFNLMSWGRDAHSCRVVGF